MNIVLELHHSKSLKYYFLYASQRTISNCTLFFEIIHLLEGRSK